MDKKDNKKNKYYNVYVSYKNRVLEYLISDENLDKLINEKILVNMFRK